MPELPQVLGILRHYGVLPASEPKRRRLAATADKSMVISVTRQGDLTQVSAATGDGRFEHFTGAGDFASVNSSNPGEPDNWRDYLLCDMSLE